MEEIIKTVISALGYIKERGCYDIPCDQCPFNNNNSTTQQKLCHVLATEAGSPK